MKFYKGDIIYRKELNAGKWVVTLLGVVKNMEVKHDELTVLFYRPFKNKIKALFKL